MRGIIRNGFKEKKARSWNEKAMLHEWRALWADHVNRALERAGVTERVTKKSFEDMGLDKTPTKHLGVDANEMELRGEKTRIGDENRKAAERAREQLERENREFFARNRNLVAEAAIAEKENRAAHARRELLNRGSAFWAQVDKEFAQEEQGIRGYYDLEALAQSLSEARERVRDTDTANGRLSGVYDAALGEAQSIEQSLENARERQAEALGKLEADRAILREARDERAQRMSAKLDAQRGGVEIESPDAAIEQDNAAGLSVEDFEEGKEQWRGQDDDMELSR